MRHTFFHRKITSNRQEIRIRKISMCLIGKGRRGNSEDRSKLKRIKFERRRYGYTVRLTIDVTRRLFYKEKGLEMCCYYVVNYDVTYDIDIAVVDFLDFYTLDEVLVFFVRCIAFVASLFGRNVLGQKYFCAFDDSFSKYIVISVCPFCGGINRCKIDSHSKICKKCQKRYWLV